MPVLAGSQFLVYAGVSTLDAGGTATDLTTMVRPDVSVTADTEVVLDARAGKPVDVRTPRPTEGIGGLSEVDRYVPGTGTLIVGLGSGTGRLYIVPSEPAKRGSMEFSLKSERDKPKIAMRLAGPGVALPPRYLTLDSDAAPRLDGARKLGVVFAGAGRRDDYD